MAGQQMLQSCSERDQFESCRVLGFFSSHSVSIVWSRSRTGPSLKEVQQYWFYSWKMQPGVGGGCVTALSAQKKQNIWRGSWIQDKKTACNEWCRFFNWTKCNFPYQCSHLLDDEVLLNRKANDGATFRKCSHLLIYANALLSYFWPSKYKWKLSNAI